MNFIVGNSKRAYGHAQCVHAQGSVGGVGRIGFTMTRRDMDVNSRV